MTRREAELYENIKIFISNNGYSPSVRELANCIGTNSTHHVHDMLSKLRDEGYINYIDKLPRTITITK